MEKPRNLAFYGGGESPFHNSFHFVFYFSKAWETNEKQIQPGKAKKIGKAKKPSIFQRRMAHPLKTHSIGKAWNSLENERNVDKL